MDLLNLLAKFFIVIAFSGAVLLLLFYSRREGDKREIFVFLISTLAMLLMSLCILFRDRDWAWILFLCAFICFIYSGFMNLWHLCHRPRENGDKEH